MILLTIIVVKYDLAALLSVGIQSKPYMLHYSKEVNTMDRKAMIDAYKNRIPDMGIIALTCKATGETFLGASMDIHADFNSIRVKLNSGFHPNRRLLSLWKEHGESGFDLTVLEKVEYKDDTIDYRQKLEDMREAMIENNPLYSKIWKK